MRITADTLFLTFAGLLNFIELECATLVTLEQLFPGYNGVLPKAQIVKNKAAEKFPHFREFSNQNMVPPKPGIIAVRGRFVIGFPSGPFVFPLSSYFQEPGLNSVFDSETGDWYTVSQEDFHKLGPAPNRFFKLTKARDEAAALHKPASNSQLDQRAHIAACEHANRAADHIEEEETPRIYAVPATIDNSAARLKHAYSEMYINYTVYYKSLFGKRHIGRSY